MRFLIIHHLRSLLTSFLNPRNAVFQATLQSSRSNLIDPGVVHVELCIES